MHSDSVYQELEFVRRAKQRDERAFQFLYEKYWGRILSYVIGRLRGGGIRGSLSEEAEDTAQEIFTKVWQKLPTLREEHAFRAWLYRFAENICNNEIRKIRREQERVISTVQDENAEEPLLNIPDPTSERMERFAPLYEGIERLTKSQRKVVELYYFHGLTYQEIAYVLGKSKTRVYDIMQEAIEILKEFLSE